MNKNLHVNLIHINSLSTFYLVMFSHKVMYDGTLIKKYKLKNEAFCM